jgi:hypothetical protein
MDEKTCTQTTQAGHRYDVSWPGDRSGGGGKPAIPLKRRAEFIEDVRGEGESGAPLTTAELRAKWRRFFNADRTLSKWTKWAKDLTPLGESA